MCLFTLQDKPFVAEEDIVCYKNLSITEDGRFISPVEDELSVIVDSIKQTKKFFKAFA